MTGLKKTLTDIERHIIQDRLHQDGWNVAAAARKLGLKRTTLFMKIKRLQITKEVQDDRTQDTNDSEVFPTI